MAAFQLKRLEKKAAPSAQVLFEVRESTNDLEEKEAAAPEQVQLEVPAPIKDLEEKEAAAPEQVQLEVPEPIKDCEEKEAAAPEQVRAEDTKPQEAPLPIIPEILPLNRKQRKEAAKLKRLEEEAAPAEQVQLEVPEPTNDLEEQDAAAPEQVQLEVPEPTNDLEEKEVAASKLVILEVPEPIKNLEEKEAAAPEQTSQHDMRGLACSTAGGTHHAFPSFGSGYCLLNVLTVAAKYRMGSSSPKRKVLIVDLDVHKLCEFSLPEDVIVPQAGALRRPLLPPRTTCAFLLLFSPRPSFPLGSRLLQVLLLERDQIRQGQRATLLS
ncbi:hypothetical protein EYF80_003058 [Liparis tanakae]|uniref:Histone deacetylase domain-containing protein n=1 Tax=Liparis tanakae TaxID=230148 RepID=A0A4Z2J909_9TELE|nr:hypothetical protein EYF80_003058 [Liparis tanakae]